MQVSELKNASPDDLQGGSKSDYPLNNQKTNNDVILWKKLDNNLKDFKVLSLEVTLKKIAF